jgi:hypothetical protein
MQSLNGNVGRRLIETRLLPSPTALLVGIVDMKIASAALTLLAA